MKRDFAVDVLAAVLILGALAYLRGFRVRMKAGVILALAPEMDRVLPLIELAHEDAGIGARTDDQGQRFFGAYITSGRDGLHKAGSLHYVGRAIDLRTRDLTDAEGDALVTALRWRLPRQYDVVDERTKAGAPHIHVEYDPK